MSKIEWKSSYETGNAAVDLQHRYFVGLINRLYDELSVPGDKGHRERLLWEVVKYAELHFLSEENILLKEGLPGLEEHKRSHENLRMELGQKIQLSFAAGSDPLPILAFLGEWFINHTVNEDIKTFAPKK